mmetsp:Transcript_19754/g.14488  ORF Transcript_19754/g.14488 Transcript_19754/m.14488 type:complete len:155 (-) Transcript_19754:3701-4165(-)
MDSLFEQVNAPREGSEAKVPIEDDEDIEEKEFFSHLNNNSNVDTLNERIRKSSILKNEKMHIPYLKEEEIEYGEKFLFKMEKIKCENSFEKFPPIDGVLLVTSYKLKFINMTSEEQAVPTKSWQVVKKKVRYPPYLNDYLTIPLGLILKVEKTT